MIKLRNGHAELVNEAYKTISFSFENISYTNFYFPNTGFKSQVPELEEITEMYITKSIEESSVDFVDCSIYEKTEHSKPINTKASVFNCLVEHALFFRVDSNHLNFPVRKVW